VNYRLYHPDDFPQLYAIEEICFQPPIRFPRRYMRRLVESPDAFTWVAEDEGRIAGFSVADLGWDPDGPFAYIQTIEVLPDARGRGIGNELLRRVEGSARDKQAVAIWLHVESVNAGAIRLYEAHGYRCMGREENFYARGRAGFIYRKALEQRSENSDQRSD
jgi:ribosomal-protein-alanine N-acetyltransferase